MVSAKDVQQLNTKIEKINTNRTKAKTQQEMLLQRLDEELENYKNQYGVNLKKDSLTQTKALISDEIKKVTSAVQEEYELKEKVVRAIDEGDYDTAYKLLGVEEEIEEEVVEESLDKGTKDLEDNFDMEDLDDSDVELDDDFDMGDFDMEGLDDSDSEEEPEEVESSKEASITSASSKKKAPEGTSSIEDAFSGMEVEEDDLPGLDDEDFGFKDELMGSKFEV